MLSSNFSNIFISFLTVLIMSSYHFQQFEQKCIFHQSLGCFLSFLQLEESNFYDLFYLHHFKMITQKVYLLLKILVQLSNLKWTLCLCWFVLICVNCAFKSWFQLLLVVSCYFELIKLLQEHKVLYQSLQKLLVDLQQH